MKDFSFLKLIIFDLDETLWSGIISEQNIFVDEKIIKLIKDLVDSGVMVSICSKNDEKQVQDILTKYGIYDYFVFNSINWSPKGQRVKEIIKSMNLRDSNVAFIDDNISNLNEAKKYCPNITIYYPVIINELAEYFDKNEKKDISHTRLNQYKLLEKKKQFKSHFGNNIDFLSECDIKVEIFNNCVDEIDRIAELVARSNQLNFTKNRSTKDELLRDLNSKSTKSAYIRAKDKFGDYGIVGFYMLCGDEVKHFVFSCRTLGMGIEQYIYKILGLPKFEIVGDVASSLTEVDPFWINNTSHVEKIKTTTFENKILLKGPCDMSQMSLYLNGPNIDYEFTYVNDKGVVIENYNHTEIILNSIRLKPEEKNELIDSLPFLDNDIFNTKIFSGNYKVVVLSLFVDPNLGLYKNKNSGLIVPFGEYTDDITDESIWKDLIDGHKFNANVRFNNNILNKIKETYEFLGKPSVDYIYNNVCEIVRKIPANSKICLILGSETEYLGQQSECYKDRHIFNKQLNGKIRTLAKEKQNILLIDINKYISGQDSFTNTINHFKRIVYYQMANDLINYASDGEIKLSLENKFVSFSRRLLRKLKNFITNPKAVIKGRINRRRMKND